MGYRDYKIFCNDIFKEYVLSTLIFENFSINSLIFMCLKFLVKVYHSSGQFCTS